MDADSAWDRLVAESGDDVDIATMVTQSNIEDAQKALDKAKKQTPKLVGTTEEKLATAKAFKESVVKAQNDLAKWQEIADVPKRRASLQTEQTDLQGQQVTGKLPASEEVTPQENDTENIPVASAKGGNLLEIPTSEAVSSIQEQIQVAEAEANTNPTDKQKKAGNYKKGHVQIGSFNITIEQPKGSVRSGVDADGKKWETTMQNTYGYIRGTEGVDGDHIDVFLSDDIDGWDGHKVFVVDQYNEDGSFDEHKVMLGFNDIDEADAAYLSNYEKGWANNRKIVIRPTNIEDFEKWIASSHRKTKPFAEYKSMQIANNKGNSEKVEEEKDVIEELRERNRVGNERDQRAGRPPRPSDYIEAIGKGDDKAMKAWEGEFNDYAQKLNVDDLPDIESTIRQMQGHIDTIRSGNPKGYKDNSAYKAYSGIKKMLEKRRRELNKQSAEENTRLSAMSGVGLVEDARTRTLGDKTRKMLDAMAKRLGLQVEFVDEIVTGKDEKGRNTYANADIVGNKVRIAWDKRDQALDFLLGHEFTHRMQALSPEAYAEFVEATKQALGEKEWNKRINRMKSLYKQHGIAISEQGIIDEVVADYAGKLVEERGVFDNFVERNKNNRGLLSKIADVLRSIKEFFTLGKQRKINNAIARLEALIESASEANVREDVRKGQPLFSLQGNSLTEEVESVLEDYTLNKDNVGDFEYALMQSIAGQSYSARPDYKVLDGVVVRVKGHTPDWDNFVNWETDKVESEKILNVTVGNYEDTDYRRNKEDYESFAEAHPETTAVNVDIEDGTSLADALSQIHEALKAKGIDFEFAPDYSWTKWSEYTPKARYSLASDMARDAVMTALEGAGIDVEIATPEMVEDVLRARDAEFMSAKKRRALETVSSQDEYQQTVVSSADGAKVLKNLDSLAKKYQENTVTHEKTFLGKVAEAIGAKKYGSNSQYATFETVNGKIVTIRLADHNATVSNFDIKNESEGISIVVSAKKSEGIYNDGDAHIVEYYYDAIKLRKAEGKPLADIVKSIKQALYSGVFNDSTGLAEYQEVNIPEFHIVYHGSGAKFDEFDHSHMGEGEGNQAYGWGTYLTEVEGIAKLYAQTGDAYRNQVKAHLKGTKQYLKEAHEMLNEYKGVGNVKGVAEMEKTIANLEDDIVKYQDVLDNTETSHNIYTVEIPDDTGKNYLDYDKEMPKKELNEVRNKLEAILAEGDYKGVEKELKRELDSVFVDGLTASDVYGNVSAYLGGDKQASEFFNEMGYVGIKYPANYRSGGNEDGKNNFVIFNDSDMKITDRVEFLQTPDGIVYGWTIGGKIFLTEQGMNAETPIHEYTHLWANAMRRNNEQGWESVKDLLRGTPMWDEVLADKNYSNIHDNEDLVASEVLSRYSGKDNAKRLEDEAQRMISEAKGIGAKADAVSLIDRVRRALQKFWDWVGKDLFGIKDFDSIEQVTDRVLYDLMNQTDLNAEVSEGEANPIAEKEVVNVILNDTDEIRLPRNREEAYNFIPQGGAVFHNNDQNTDVRVSRHTIKHSTLHDNTDNYAIFAGIEKIVNEAIKIGDIPVAENEKGKTNSVGIYYIPINVNGSQYSARLVIKELINRDRVLDELSLYNVSMHKEKGSAIQLLNASNEVGSITAKPQSAYKVKDLIHNSQEQDKKLLGISNKTKFSLQGGRSIADKYEKRVNTKGKGGALHLSKFNFMEAWQDEMRALKEVQRIIEQEYGIVLESYEDAYMAENAMSSIAKASWDRYINEVYEPMMRIHDEWIRSGESNESINHYLIAKSGLERNRELMVRDAFRAERASKEESIRDEYRSAIKDLNEKYKPMELDLLNQYRSGAIDKDTYRNERKNLSDAKKAERKPIDDKYQLDMQDIHDKMTQVEEEYKAKRNALRDDLKAGNIGFAEFCRLSDDLALQYSGAEEIADYSGLTALAKIYGRDYFYNFAMGMVDAFERRHSNTDVMWEHINNNTKAAVDYSYKSGVTSKQAKEHLDQMFVWYVPMKGHADVEAEDIYTYVNDKSSSFTPTVARAKGHTKYVSEDVMALIANTMQSAILQGERNKVKQKFLNMVQNYPTDLFSVDNGWVELQGNDWVEVFPDINENDTPEEVRSILPHQFYNLQIFYILLIDYKTNNRSLIMPTLLPGCSRIYVQ